MIYNTVRISGVQQSECYTYTNIYLILDSLTIKAIAVYWWKFPVLYSRSLLIINLYKVVCIWGFPCGAMVKNLPAMQKTQETWVRSLVEKIPWSRKWQPTPVFLPGKSHGQRSLEGYSPRGHEESDMTDWVSTHAQCVYINPNLPIYPSSYLPLSC